MRKISDFGFLISGESLRVLQYATWPHPASDIRHPTSEIQS
jgi:hypothetical protein